MVARIAVILAPRPTYPVEVRLVVADVLGSLAKSLDCMEKAHRSTHDQSLPRSKSVCLGQSQKLSLADVD